METDSEQPLPPPKEVARKLRSLAIQTVQSWQASYGTAYKKLALGFHFLKQVKKVRVTAWKLYIASSHIVKQTKTNQPYHVVMLSGGLPGR